MHLPSLHLHVFTSIRRNVTSQHYILGKLIGVLFSDARLSGPMCMLFVSRTLLLSYANHVTMSVVSIVVMLYCLCFDPIRPDLALGYRHPNHNELNNFVNTQVDMTSC